MFSWTYLLVGHLHSTEVEVSAIIWWRITKVVALTTRKWSLGSSMRLKALRTDGIADQGCRPKNYEGRKNKDTSRKNYDFAS